MEDFSCDGYYPLLVGMHEQEFQGYPILRDSRGDSIAERNPFYCELTGLYWAWKNQLETLDYIGLCHYRRFFSFDPDDDQWVLRSLDRQDLTEKRLSLDELDTLMVDADIILPKPMIYPHNLRNHYKDNHRAGDLQQVFAIVGKLYPEYKVAMNKVFKQHACWPYNMFICRKEVFADYMEWLFTILFELERRIEIPVDDAYQRRVFGFIAERLLNVYVWHHNLRVKELPVIFFPNEGKQGHTVKDNFIYRTKRALLGGY
ncbi:MAG: DUF4422 domain-containing protein [Veillonella sp.]|nr:DUF4422 domain-containing protein [Veillonella sp.]